MAKIPKIKKKNGYNTNLAAEFFVLSMLHRLGADATLTLGNKKSVDIVVVCDEGKALTIDVKGLAGKTGWPIDNLPAPRLGHFIVLISFLGKITDPSISPEAYVIPSSDIRKLTYFAPGGRKLITLSMMRNDGAPYRNAWAQLSLTVPKLL
jgi:hypothetical protein